LRRSFTIELLEEHDRVNIYSLRFEGEAFTEFEKFLFGHKQRHGDDIGRILARLDKIGTDGVFERHFRYAATKRDRVAELPANIDTSQLRVYCLCLTENILILGNGGVKSTRTYNEDPLLNSFVNIMLQVESVIKEKQKKGLIELNGKELAGTLTLSIEI